MATAVVARPVARPQARARDEEVLVWPDLVFIEFISAMVFTITLFLLAVLVNAPLLDQANADVTPNPSKAPWYLLNLQELLLHMNAAMAGVIIPTIWLGVMAAFPYFDREQEGQGGWFATENSVRITVAAGLVGILGTVGLIMWDSGKLAYLLNKWFGLSGGDHMRFLENVRAIQSGLPWPEWSRDIPYLPFNLKLLSSEADAGQGPTQFQHLDFPAWLVEQGIPIAVMVGLPTIMIFTLWKLGWVKTRRDALLALFSGFVGAYGVLTLVGTAFRGESQELVFPWELTVAEGIPGQE
ncbi:MAG: menaquinol-cytochrome C reductase [Dehalococcoidia bacterium]